MSGVIVDTNYGPVRGLKRTSVAGDEYISFRGIPYASAPIGELRFKVCVTTQFGTIMWIDLPELFVKT